MRIEANPVAEPVRDYVGYGREVPWVVWPDGARLALNIVVNYEEASEVHMAANGRNEAALAEIPYAMEGADRDLAMESVYEYGSRAGIWRLQRTLEARGVPITFSPRSSPSNATPGWLRGGATAITKSAAMAGAGRRCGVSPARRRRRTCGPRSRPSRRRAGAGRSAGIAATGSRSTRAS